MILDIIVLIILLLSTGIAFFRGFIREALSIATLLLAIGAAYLVGPLLEPLIANWMGVVPGEEPEKFLGVLPKDLVAQIAAQGSVFLLVMISLSIVTHIFAEYIKSIGLGAVDRSLGALFGFIRAVIVLILLYLPIHILVDQETRDSWFETSKSRVYLETGSEFAASRIPEDFIQEKFQKAQKTVDETPQVNRVRERLQQMDLLRDDLTAEERAKLVREKFENGELDQMFEEEGYSEEFRDQIDQLFQEQNIQQDNNYQE